MSNWKEYILYLKEKYVGKKLRYKGDIYNIVGIECNGAIIIDLPNKHNETTALFLSYDLDRNIIY